MFFSGGAAALALFSLLPVSWAQTLNQNCQYTPAWKPCNLAPNTAFADRLECGAMKVAKNWKGYKQGTSEETILRLIRFKSTVAGASSIVVNPGGPGGSGIDTVLSSGWYYSQISGGQYHIIGFDPRGTGLNMPYSISISNTPVGNPGVNYDDPNIFANQLKFYDQTATSAASQQPDLGTIIDSVQTAYDVFAISEAVNSDKLIRYMGFSYGTLLGNVIARLFPGRIERMQLDGNIDPNSYYYKSGAQEYTDNDRAVEKFFTDCSLASVQDCNWHGATRQSANALIQKYRDFVGFDPTATNRGRAANHPLSLAHSNHIRGMMVNYLKNPASYKDLARVLQIWFQYPGAVRRFCSDETIATYPKYSGDCPAGKKKRQAIDPSFDPATAKNAKVDFNILGIKCLDNALRSPLTADQYKTWFQEGIDASKYSNDIAIIGINYCAPWKQEPAYGWKNSAQPQWTTIDNKETILFVQTYYDTVTPSLSAENARKYYSKSRIVYTNGQGHCSNAHRSATLEAALVKYWNPSTTALDRIPAAGSVYGVDKPNPFTDNPDAPVVDPDKTEEEVVGPQVEGDAGTEPDPNADQPPPAKRDLSGIFKNVEQGMYNRYSRQPSYKFERRASEDTVTPDTNIDFETCDDGSTTTTTTSTTTSTTTNTGSTTTSMTTTTTTVTGSSTTSTTTSTTTNTGSTTTSMTTTTTTVTGSSTTSTTSTSQSSIVTTSSLTSTTSTTSKPTSSTTSTGSVSTTTTSSGKFVISTTSTGLSSTSGTTSLTSFTYTTSTMSGTTTLYPSTTSTASTVTSTSIVSHTSGPPNTYSIGGNGGLSGSTWGTWVGSSTTKHKDPEASTWASWAGSSTTKPKDPATSSWGSWGSKTDSWEVWTSQKDSVPVTKTVCADKGQCKTQVVAIPTKTVYVDYITDVCETGLTTKIVTITATCTQGCDSKPTGVPQGYKTTAVYCSACAQPSTVTVTVKVEDGAKATAWANIPDGSATSNSVRPTATPTDKASWSTWNDAADGSNFVQVNTSIVSSATWSAWSGAASGVDAASKTTTGTDSWSTWASATGSGPIAKYTGAASSNRVAEGSLLAAIFAGLLML